jgi:signal transduction histidine kinase/ligand-binding sensor domain-containing protein
VTRRWRTAAPIAALGVLLGGAPAPAGAERLAIKAYTTADGLPHDHVKCIVPDSRGFLWLCTAQGLSRFDGRHFVNYGTGHGLEELYVNDFLETRRGGYWVATNGKGVYRLDPDAAERLFVPERVGAGTASNRVNALFEGPSGRLWAGTDDGLYLSDGPAGGFRAVVVAGAAPAPLLHVAAFAPDSRGDLWAMTSAGALRLSDDPPRAVPAPKDQSPFALLAGLEERLLRHSDGRIFVGGRRGLGTWDGARPRLLTTAHGLSDDVVTALAEDRYGNLWIGTETGGTMRLASHGFTTFDDRDGLGHRRVASIFETRAGELCVRTAFQWLNRFDGRMFTALRPALTVPASIQTAHGFVQDREAQWWLATPRGLARYAAAPTRADLARRTPTAVYTTRDGLVSDDVASPFEDHAGDVWVAARRAAGLTRWERATGSIRSYGAADGLPPGNVPVAFAEDAAGTLWVGFREGGLARRRGDGFEFFGASAGVPAAHTRSLYRDSGGRLWAATTGGGLLAVEDPAGERPRFVRYSTADGLTTDHVRCVTDDGRGRLYLGTAVGVDRFDPATRTVVHYTTDDGLAQNEVQAAFRDSSGALWFGTMAGVSRLVPVRQPAAPGTPVLIGAVAAGGVPRPLSALGARAVDEFEVGPESASVRIDYFGFAFVPGERLLFQYRLVGGDGRWSDPTPRDSVEYGALAPGRYRFEVRGQGGDEPPATVAFRVRPPVWRRWWFVSLVVGAVVLAAQQAHRVRLRRVVELEKVRTRIASDLHDDIGSSLSQIAILSEVAARDLGAEAPTRDLLARIAAASRDTAASMGDIVWAINAGRDTLGDLVHRMRRVASDVFTARDIAFTFQAEVPREDAPLGADRRRQVFLLFKEAVHNAARHSGATRAEAAVTAEGGTLRVRLTDDGRGFDPGSAYDGHGLHSMHSRAQALGGDLRIDSAPGRGTTVTLTVPLRG